MTVIDNTHIPYIGNAIKKLSKVPDSRLSPAAIKLRAWLIKNKMTVTQFSMRCGFKEQTIYNYVCGVPCNYPSLAQAYAIEYLTKGHIRAWEWLDDPFIEAGIRKGQQKRISRFETSVKSFVLKYNKLKTNEGMIRHRARILSRLFGVDWGEAKKRCWIDAKPKARLERADLTDLLREPITEEEHNGQNES